MDANRRACLIALLAAGIAGAQSSAQKHFEQGLRWLHSFEYDDAREEFVRARSADPKFVMAYWGEALSHTEFIWHAQDLNAGRTALARLAATPAERRKGARTERERHYLAAVEALYGSGDYHIRTVAYEEAMRQLVSQHPDDLDGAALYSLAILGTAHKGRDFTTYMRAAAVAEEVYARDQKHPGALHYLIHCYDDPVHAPLGLRAARRYASVAPDAAHALHMPSHIFVAMGMWDEVVASNEASWNASVSRVERKKLQIEERSYHALYWLEYAYLQQGRYREAANLLDIVRKDAESSGAAYLRYHLALMSAAYVLETGEEAKLPPALQVTDIDKAGAAAYLFAKGYLAWQRGDREATHRAARNIRTAGNNSRTPSEHTHTAGAPSEEVAALQLEGLLAGAGGTSLLEKAARLEESIPFEFGPPLPPKPVHELLGEVLLKAGRHKEARAHFAQALARTPGKSIPLRGLARAAAASGDRQAARAIYSELRNIRRKADVPWPE